MKIDSHFLQILFYVPFFHFFSIIFSALQFWIFKKLFLLHFSQKSVSLQLLCGLFFVVGCKLVGFSFFKNVVL